MTVVMVTAGHLACGPVTAMRSLSSALGNRHDQEGAARHRPVGGGRRNGHDRRHPDSRQRGHAHGDQAPARAYDPARTGCRGGGHRVRAGGPGGVRHRADRGSGQVPAAGGPGGSPSRRSPSRTRGLPRAWQVPRARPGPGPAGAAGWRSAGGAPSAGGHAGRDGGTRSGRPSVLNPTSVYSPGGLIDMPGDGRAPGTPGGQDIPEILRTAGPGPARGGPVPGAQTGGRGQDRPPSGWAGPQPPRPGYQPGMNPGGPGWPPHGPGGQPGPMPPHDRGRPREAPRAGHPAPGRDGAPGREPFPPRGAGPGQNPRDASAGPGPPRPWPVPRPA